MTKNQMMKKILSLLILFPFSYPLELEANLKEELMHLRKERLTEENV